MKPCKHKNKNPIAHSRGAENTTLYECLDCGESFWVTLNDEIAQTNWDMNNNVNGKILKGSNMKKFIISTVFIVILAGCTVAEWQDPNGKPQTAANKTQEILSGVEAGLDATPPFPMKEAMYGVLAALGGIATAVQSFKKNTVTKEKITAEHAVTQIVKGVDDLVKAGIVTKDQLKATMKQTDATKDLVVKAQM